MTAPSGACLAPRAKHSMARARRYALVLCFGLLLGAVAAPAAAALEVIELRGRSAEELIPVLQPLLEPGTALSGRGQRLIVRGSPAAIAELRRLVARLDAPLRNLLVEVRHVQRSVREAQQAGARVRLGDDPDVQVQAARHATSSRTRDAQQVRTIEGREVFVRSASERRVPVTETHVVNGRVVTLTGSSEVSAASGFYLTPSVRGEEVIVDVAASRQAFTGGGAAREGSAVRTRVRGPLGAWITLGGIDASRSAQGAGVLSRRSLSSERGLVTEVRVSLLP